jgi:hypothetical protein
MQNLRRSVTIGNARENAINYLKKNMESLKTKQVTIGIDSAIDKIVRVVNSKSDKNEYVYFNDIAEFGNHIVSKSGKSCGIEIVERFTKLGGNAPIMSEAMGTLDVKVNCVSPLGYPDINPVFKKLSYNCTLYTIGNPAFTTALEFNDGKIMLGQVEFLDKVDWCTLKEMLSLEQINTFFKNSNLIGLVNWSCMLGFNNILNGILNEVLTVHESDKSKIIFFDLADYSKRESKDVFEVVQLINRFNKYFKVIFGLNENETVMMYKILFNNDIPDDLLTAGQQIYDFLNVDTLVIHTLTNSIAYDENEVVQVPSLFVKQPKLSTGGGDNFNAGLCYGQLIGLNLEESLYTANATSGYYVRNAKSPNVEELIDTLGIWNNLMEYPI